MASNGPQQLPHVEHEERRHQKQPTFRSTGGGDAQQAAGADVDHQECMVRGGRMCRFKLSPAPRRPGDKDAG